MAEEDPRRWGIGDFVLAWLLVAVVGSLALAGACAADGVAGSSCRDELGGRWLFLSLVPSQAVMGTAAVMLARLRGSGDVRRDLALALPGRDTLVGLGAGFAAQLALLPAMYWLIFQLVERQDVAADARDLVERVRGDAVAIALVVVVVVLFAPVVEELFYRGMLFRILSARLPVPWVVVVQAAVFATLHFQLLQWPGLFVFGLVAGTLRARSGSLGAPIAAHAAFNAVTVVAIVA